jgi:ABC-type lipoprotein export system ATPase subunit
VTFRARVRRLKCTQDTKNAGRVAEVFERLVRAGDRTVVMVTHNPELAARTDRQIRIVDGRIVEDTGGARG